MANYTVTTNFGDKDALATGNSAKIVKGSEFTTEFNNIATHSAEKSNTASPTFTGTVVIPTATIATANIAAGAINATSLDLLDNQKIKLGTGDDLEIYHNASNSVIADVGVGNLELRGTNVVVQNSAGTETLASFTENGGAVFYYDNSAKIATDTNGIAVAGNVDMPDGAKVLLGDSDDLKLYHDASNSYIEDSGTGGLKLLTTQLLVKNAADDENIITASANGSVDLFHDNAKKLETLTNGVGVTGLLYATVEAGIGVADPARALHVLHASDDIVARFESGDTSSGIEIKDNTTTALLKTTNGITILSSDALDAADDSVLSLRVDAVEKIKMTDTQNLMAQNTRFPDGVKALFGDSDLEIYHNGSHSFISDQGTGSLKLLASNATEIADAANAKTSAVFNPAASTFLYNNNSQKFRTTATGIEVTGDVDTDSVTLGTVRILTGAGAPNVAAVVGSMYLRTDGGGDTTLWIKETGTDSSGWVAK